MFRETPSSPVLVDEVVSQKIEADLKVDFFWYRLGGATGRGRHFRFLLLTVSPITIFKFEGQRDGRGNPFASFTQIILLVKQPNACIDWISPFGSLDINLQIRFHSICFIPAWFFLCIFLSHNLDWMLYIYHNSFCFWWWESWMMSTIFAASLFQFCFWWNLP